MSGKPVVLIVLSMVCASMVVAVTQPQAAQKEISFVRDPNREFVYLKFERIGTGIRRSKDEPSLRVWLRFVNNCNVPIGLRTNGVPDGSPADEAGVEDDVVQDPPMLTITAEDSSPEVEHVPPSDTGSAAIEANDKRQNINKMPSGYSEEVASLTTVAPGGSILFSVPVDHVGSREHSWHMEIPFRFKVPKGWGPRDPVVGGEPVMSLHYAFYNLPDEVQARLRKGFHE